MAFPDLAAIADGIANIVRSDPDTSTITVVVGSGIKDMGRMPWLSIHESSVDLDTELVGAGQGPWEWTVRFDLRLYAQAMESAEQAMREKTAWLSKVIDVLHKSANRTLGGNVLMSRVVSVEPLVSTEQGERVNGSSLILECRVRT